MKVAFSSLHEKWQFFCYPPYKLRRAFFRKFWPGLYFCIIQVNFKSYGIWQVILTNFDRLRLSNGGAPSLHVVSLSPAATTLLLSEVRLKADITQMSHVQRWHNFCFLILPQTEESKCKREGYQNQPYSMQCIFFFISLDNIGASWEPASLNEYSHFLQVCAFTTS